MAVKLVLEVEHDGKKYKVTIAPKTYIAFEKKFGMTVNQYQQDPSAEGLYWLAWQQSLNDGITSEGFTQWIEHLEDAGFEEQGEEHPKEQEVISDTVLD